MAKILKLEFELLDHPPYSPDLALSDFFLFPKLYGMIISLIAYKYIRIIHRNIDYFCIQYYLELKDFLDWCPIQTIIYKWDLQ